MKPEQVMWDAIRPAMVAAGLDPVRVENLAGPGTPDVNYVHGWIELKYVDRWPPRGGPLKIDHYTKQQRSWAVRRAKAGGKIFLLLKVGKTEWLLFHGLLSATYLGYKTKDELYEICLARWERLPMKEELLKCLNP